MNGTVKFFNVMKSYGFITGEDGTDYFVHKSGLKEDVTIRENDEVTFDVEQGDRGPKAVNVSLSSGESEESEEPDESEEPEE
jgi:CspA family cold shock protein